MKEQPEKVIREFNRHYARRRDSDCLFVRKLRESGLTTEQIADVLAAYEDVCHSCFDNEAGCFCSNDD